jgi:hypothetical protein
MTTRRERRQMERERRRANREARSIRLVEGTMSAEELRKVPPVAGFREEPIVTEWMRQMWLGEREPESIMVSVRDVMPNPFYMELNELGVESIVMLMKRGEWREPWLMVARLPDGGYVDVDTAYEHEAAMRAGYEAVHAHVIGEFTTEDCQRIGIRTSWPKKQALTRRKKRWRLRRS